VPVHRLVPSLQWAAPTFSLLLPPLPPGLGPILRLIIAPFFDEEGELSVGHRVAGDEEVRNLNLVYPLLDL
jgi:hypothetical protein